MLRLITVIGVHGQHNRLRLMKRNLGTAYVRLKKPMPLVVGNKSKLTGKIS
jgi:hypothetical protein